MNSSSTLPSSYAGKAGRQSASTGELTAPEGGFFPPALLQYWQGVLRWRWIIGGIIATCFVLGLVATLLMSPRFTARAQLEITREQKQITNVQGLDSADAGQDLEFYATQYSLLIARPVVLRVVRDLRLVSSQEFFEAHGLEDAVNDENVLAFPGKTRREKLERLVVDTLLKNVSISPVRTSRLVDISYTSRSPELSAKVANAWAKAFISTSMDRQFASTADARNFLEQRLGTLRQKLEESERQAVTYASAQGIINLDKARGENGKTEATRTLAASDLEALNSALNQAVSSRISAQSRVGAKGDVTPESVTSLGLANMRNRRAELASQYSGLMVLYEPGYPAAVEIAQQIRTLDAEMARETSRISGSRQLEYREATARESDLRRQVTDLKARLDGQQRAGIQLAIYQREADTNRQLYDALLQRYKEIGVAGIVGASNIAIVETAETPDKPSAPSLLLNLVLALLIGGVLAGITAFVLEHVDEGLREPSQVQPLLNLPLLGQTPMVDGDVISELKDTKSHYYEAYFSIQSNLSFTTNHGFPRSMTVASTRSGEGKSSTSLALAVILGRTGKRVLLVDADMRSPSIHEMVSAENAKGLSNYLAGEDNWLEFVQETDFKGVEIIAAGPVPPSAAELLSGDRLQPLIQSVLSKYDHIVIDSPPVMGLTDAPVLSRAVEGCVFVVQHDSAPLRGIRTSIDRLRMVKAHVFGVVLTKMNNKRSGFGYGYGYGYGYGGDDAGKAAAGQG